MLFLPLLSFSQSQHKTEGKITESPRAMAKLLKEAKRVKQVLSANTEIYSQVLIIFIGGKIIIYTCACYTVQPPFLLPLVSLVLFFTLLPSFSFSAYSFLTAWYLKLEKILIINIHIFLFSLQVEGLFEDIDFKAKITRSEFEEMCSDLFDRIAHPVEQALRVADITLVCIIMSCHMTIV